MSHTGYKPIVQCAQLIADLCRVAHGFHALRLCPFRVVADLLQRLGAVGNMVLQLCGDRPLLAGVKDPRRGFLDIILSLHFLFRYPLCK